MWINGVTQYLWRVVDHEGEVLESFVTKTRDRKAALSFLTKAMKRHCRPEVIVTDRFRSHGAPLKELGRGDDREMGRWLNNRVDNSHLPFRQRERAMLLFRRMRTLQKLDSVHASVPQPLSDGAPPPEPRPLQAVPRRRSRRVARAFPCLMPERGGRTETGSPLTKGTNASACSAARVLAEN